MHLRRPGWQRLTRKEIHTEVDGGQTGSNPQVLVNAIIGKVNFYFKGTVKRLIIRACELLRFHSKHEKPSDEVENVKNDRPIVPYPSDRPFGLASNTLGEDSPCRIISIRPPQKKAPASTSATSTCFAAARAQRSWL